MIFQKLGGGKGLKAVGNFSEDSSVSVPSPVPNLLLQHLKAFHCMIFQVQFPLSLVSIKYKHFLIFGLGVPLANTLLWLILRLYQQVSAQVFVSLSQLKSEACVISVSNSAHHPGGGGGGVRPSPLSFYGGTTSKTMMMTKI